AGIVVESQNVWRIDGDVPLDEVERAVGYGLPEGDFETFAGLTIFHEGGFPELGAVVRIPLPGVPGDIVETEKRLRMLDVEVQAVAKRIPQRLRAVLVELDAAASDGEGATE
ncbi:transporter associated domain-containing protein, partial [uncultured Agrococcus sp.]|uniref:transporter associated domain-containing protein n=1 Tax=uncultured Agrococcus sp. TaxID=382258 RepID=UPI0025FA6E7A